MCCAREFIPATHRASCLRRFVSCVSCWIGSTIRGPESCAIRCSRCRFRRIGSNRRVAPVRCWAIGSGSNFPGRTRPVTTDPVEAILNRSWRSTLSIIGAEGLPPLDQAGNVLRPGTAVKLSIRLPPTADPERAAQRLKTVLEADPPYDARVKFEVDGIGSGWNAPPTATWLKEALEGASLAAFEREPVWMGE